MSALETIALNDFTRQWRTIAADATHAFTRVGESGWYILGKEVERFESALAASWTFKHAVGCANGLDAIEIGLRAMGLSQGQKVLTTPLSAFATTLAIVRAGGVPVFIDVDPTGSIDLRAAAAVLGSKPEIRFFVPVHLFGHPFDLDQLAELKTRFKLLVLEDCAQSIGATFRGRPAGSVGQCLATSFYPTKNLGCMGDGGALLTNEPTLSSAARTLRDYGQSEKYFHDQLGLNSRLDELQAAILQDALLPRLESWTARRSQIAAKYLAGIKNAQLKLITPIEGATSAWHLFPLLIQGGREAFQKHLRAYGVASAIHYPRLIPNQDALKRVPFEVIGPLTNAERFAASEVSIPIHPFLTDEEVDRVIAACNGWKG